MFSLLSRRRRRQSAIAAFLLGILAVAASNLRADDPPPVDVPDAAAASADQMKPYNEVLFGTDVKFEMLPIPGGTYQMGSPQGEAARKPDEGPRHEVEVAPFWMGKCEVTWDAYEIWMYSMDIQRRKVEGVEPTPREQLADAVARPTKPYTDMSFGMGKKGYPAICMTQLAARSYCVWLTTKTGRYYRLPTEAEWEYACRAGTDTAYSFGDDPAPLDQYAWYFDNSGDKYHPVGQKKPNPWGLYDMHGNVSEWVLDQYDEHTYAAFAGRSIANPLVQQTAVYPLAVRGGSWDDDPDRLRSAARRGSNKDWKKRDPQIPKSIWYFTDALFLGFRVVRPLEAPPLADRQAKWDAGVDQ